LWSGKGIDPARGTVVGHDPVARVCVSREVEVSSQTLPGWIRARKLHLGSLHEVRGVMARGGLHTVCDEARCPNRSECFARGTATFLILGVDQRTHESGPTRTDVILLAHSDPARGRAVLMSLPRDLWLEQPNGSPNRLNTAAFVAYDADDPHAGPRYLAQTLQRNFNLPVQGYLLVNFDGFTRVVDAAGGVDVDVPAPIVNTQYPTADYGVTTIRFDAGPQHLDGEQALIYVRTRHQDSDFGRAARQQQVIQGLARSLILPTGWLRIPAVIMAALSAAQTDLSLGEVGAWLQLMVYMATGRTESLVLGQDYTTPWTTPTGGSVLLPNWDAILPQMDALLP